MCFRYTVNSLVQNRREILSSCIRKFDQNFYTISNFGMDTYIIYAAIFFILFFVHFFTTLVLIQRNDKSLSFC